MLIEVDGEQVEVFTKSEHDSLVAKTIENQKTKLQEEFNSNLESKVAEALETAKATWEEEKQSAVTSVTEELEKVKSVLPSFKEYLLPSIPEELRDKVKGETDLDQINYILTDDVFRYAVEQTTKGAKATLLEQGKELKVKKGGDSTAFDPSQVKDLNGLTSEQVQKVIQYRLTKQ